MKYKKLLKSRTFWTIVALFVISGVEGVSGMIPMTLMPYVQGALGLLALYFKANPSQDYSK